MASVSGHMAQGWLGWQQGLATWIKGGWDGNRVWPHATREAEKATGSGQNGTREDGIVTGSGHMTPG